MSASTDKEIMEWLKAKRRKDRIKKASEDLLFALEGLIQAHEAIPRGEEEGEDPLTNPDLWRRAREAVWKAKGS